jgi:hypothetical protein
MVPRDGMGGGRPCRAAAPGPLETQNAMNIAAHITFYYNEERTKYLNKILTNLDNIGMEHNVTIYIYANKQFPITVPLKNAKTQIIVTAFPDWRILKRFYKYLPYSIREHVDPFYLSWKHRQCVLETLDSYDVQIYLEDDIDFTNVSLQYWLNYKDICYRNNCNPGFIRVEFDERADKWFCSDFDLTWRPETLIEVGGLPFAVSTQYYAFWIYDKSELRRFAGSERWRLSHGENIRERAALGWHGVDHKMYKANVVPVKNIGQDLYAICDECAVHHMPNNYIGHPSFCTVEFPPRIRSG